MLKSSETNDTDLDNLCLTLLNLDRIDEDRLEAWIEFAILRHLTGQDNEETQQQPAGSSTPVVVRSDTAEEEKPVTSAGSSSGKPGEAESFARTLLKMLLKHLSPNSRGNVTPDLVLIMVKLAGVGQGSGHRDLYLAALDWLLKYQQVMPTESWTALNQEDLSSPPPELASFCCLLQYTTDVLYALRMLSSNNVSGAGVGNERSSAEMSSGLLETIEGNPLTADVEDGVDELGLGDDVESDGDESDEDLLCNQL